MAELVEAAWKQKWEQVEVRLPLEAAVSSVRSVVSRPPEALSVAVARRIRSCYAESIPPSSGAPQAILIPHAGAPSCRSRRQFP